MDGGNGFVILAEGVLDGRRQRFETCLSVGFYVQFFAPVVLSSGEGRRRAKPGDRDRDQRRTMIVCLF